MHSRNEMYRQSHIIFDCKQNPDRDQSVQKDIFPKDRGEDNRFTCPICSLVIGDKTNRLETNRRTAKAHVAWKHFTHIDAPECDPGTERPKTPAPDRQVRFEEEKVDPLVEKSYRDAVRRRSLLIQEEKTLVERLANLKIDLQVANEIISESEDRLD